MTPTGASTDVNAGHMDRALRLARDGWGHVSPNPLVGAVVVRDGTVVGEGYHAAFGGEHAEVVALREAGELSRNADLYVTLEPCSHMGKTPPCVEAIIEAGVRRVVIANRDPNPMAAGGAAILEGSGIEVVLGVRRERAARLNAGFHLHSRGLGPLVTLKLAVSRDLKIAARPGERTPITGAAAQRWVHLQRAGYDAIMVGGRTAQIDDPYLMVRGRKVRRQPRRVVVDPDLDLPIGSHLVDSASQAPLIVLCGPGASSNRRRRLEDEGAEVVTVRSESEGRLSLTDVLQVLSSLDVASVLVEGGGRLATALLRQGLVHRQLLLLAPITVGPEGVPAYEEALVDEFGVWKVSDRQVLGNDVLIELDSTAALQALEEAA